MNSFNCVQSVIYVNFVIEVKFLLDVKKTNTEIKNARNKIVKFYDQLFLSDDFKKITKENFKEMKRRYRNAHDVIKKRNEDLLKKCYVSIGASFSKFKKRTREKMKNISFDIDTEKKNDQNEKQNDQKEEKNDFVAISEIWWSRMSLCLCAFCYRITLIFRKREVLVFVLLLQYVVWLNYLAQ